MRGHLRTAFIIALTVALMAFFLRSADLASVWSEIRRARLDLVIAGIGAISVSYVVRVGRWQRLLAPIGQVGFAPAARATVIGFATTAVLPGRLGELLRPYLLARRERLSASAALATIVLERLLDLIAVVLLFGLFLVFFAGDLRDTSPQLLAALKVGGLVAASGAGIALGVIVAAARSPDRVAAVVAQIERRLPLWIGASVGRFVTRFSAGLGIARQPGRFVRAFAWSFPLWLCVCVSAWCVCHAFGIALPPGGSLLLMVLMVLGVAVPTPAGVGGFHAAVQVGVTSFYAAPVDAAVGAALVLHAVSFGPVTLLGIVLMARDGLTFRSAVNLASSGEMADGFDKGALSSTPSAEGEQTPVGPAAADDKQVMKRGENR
mgnify:FL=1